MVSISIEEFATTETGGLPAIYIPDRLTQLTRPLAAIVFGSHVSYYLNQTPNPLQETISTRVVHSELMVVRIYFNCSSTELESGACLAVGGSGEHLIAVEP